MQHRDFDVNRQQIGNHLFVHIIAGTADPHDDSEQFIISFEKPDQPFVAGKVNIIRR